MKRLLFVLTLALAVMSLSAAPVDQAAAQKMAKSYLTNERFAGKMMAPAALNPVLIKTEIGNTKSGLPVYYIFNTSATYVVVAGDDRAQEILMVGDNPLDMDQIPDAMQYLLDCYKEEIEYLQNNPTLVVEKPSRNRSLNATVYGPLLTSRWDQGSPFKNLCKFTYNGTQYSCVTGCPATAAAQVMYYWKYPAGVPALASYTGQLDINTVPGAGETNVSFTYPGLAATTFDWGNMKDYYYSYNSAQGNAVATLMRYIGQAEKMHYGVTGSGILTSQANIIATMFKNWGYQSSAQLIQKYSFSSTNWNNRIIAEMAASHPVVYMGVDNTWGGHAFNVDGYDQNTSLFHVNFGWSGNGDGWFAMNSFTDPDGATYSQNQLAIIGIVPPGGEVVSPKLTVTPTSLDFTGSVKGGVYTKTFTVSGQNIWGDVTITKSGHSYYSVSPTTITAAEASAGATVTVTYKPVTTGGPHTATFTVSTAEAEDQTVEVTGTSITPPPTLNADPASLTFSTDVGTPVSQTFHLTGVNLTGIVNLAVSGAGFSIDKTAVSKTAATNGIDITVTYNPTASGTHTGTVTLTSNGAEPFVVQLSGTAAAAPTLHANPSSLSFSTTVGQSVSKTFTLTGTDLTGIVNLAVSGAGFSIDKTAVSRTAATNGIDITVTYHPTAAGNHTGTITMTSNGAQPLTMNLSGTASNPTQLIVEPTTLNFTTLVGTPVTSTFSLTGQSLVGAVNLSVDGEGFSIDKSYINSATAMAGATVTVTYNPTSFGVHTGTITLTSNGAETVTVTLNGQADLVKFAPVMLPAAEEYIDLTQFRAEWTDETPAANVLNYTLEVTSQPAGSFSRLITDITDKYFTVEDLTAEGTFLYKVKALYLDGTESNWSNVEQVTLVAQGHGFQPGDVNHDGIFSVADVTMLISYVLSSGSGTACPICADVNGDTFVTVADVTALINIVLSAQ